MTTETYIRVFINTSDQRQAYDALKTVLARTFTVLPNTNEQFESDIRLLIN